MKYSHIILSLVLYLSSESLFAQINCDINPEDYANTMSVIAVLNVEGVESRDTNDILYALVGSECRGYGSPVLVAGEDRYFVFLIVSSNVTTNEEVSFTIYDSSSGREIPVQETVSFISDGRYGSLSSPSIFITDPNKIPVSKPEANLFFSPNDDGFNDLWVIRNNDAYDAFEITILDEAGNELFKSAPYQNDWDGKFEGDLLPEDVYYYVLKSSLRPEIFTGTISLIH